ncbi:MAG: Zn-ribbon domain-containing OB-fold protein [Candidatus Thorarchaeota archaeon]|nr:Zn-ribbon domain-containing OB-fold protein [Candidatus Thorarchaeota archaeon]
MSERPTIEQYQQYIQDNDFHALKCKSCGAVIAPPKGMCYSCGGTDLEWTTVSGKGKLVSFTVIHIAAEEFQDETPYFVAIVELDEGTRITARLLGLDPTQPEKVKLGMPLKIDYETGKSGKVYIGFRPA